MSNTSLNKTPKETKGPGNLDTIHPQFSDGTTRGPTLPESQAYSASFYYNKFRRFGDIGDLDWAVLLNRAAMENTPSGHPDLPERQGDMGTYYRTRFQKTRNFSDLEEAIFFYGKFLENTPLGHPRLGQRLDNLAVSYGVRFQQSRNADDQQRALILCRASVDATAASDPALSGRRIHLASAYNDRFRQYHNLSDLDEALHLQRQILDDMSIGNPHFPMVLKSLALSCHDRFTELGIVDDLYKAILFTKAAMETYPMGHPELPDLKTGLVLLYNSQFRRLGNIEDLEEALYIQKEVVGNTQIGHPQLSYRQARLAFSYRQKFRLLGDPKDLERAMPLSQAAIDSRPAGHSIDYEELTGLATCYGYRYEAFGNLEDLQEALHLQAICVQNTPDNDSNFHDMQMSLALYYRKQFQHSGSLDDLEQALHLENKVVKSTPSNHPELPKMLEGLAMSYNYQYTLLGSIEDLEKALDLFIGAVENTPADNPALVQRQTHLAVCYTYCFKQFGRTEDLQKALFLNKVVLEKTPRNHYSFLGILENLAHLHGYQYQKYGNIEDIEQGIQIMKTVVDETSLGHPDLVTRQEDLAVFYHYRFQKLGNIEDLDQALLLYTNVIQSTPAGHHKLSIRQRHLALLHIAYFSHSQNQSNLSCALELLSSFCQMPTGSAVDIYHAASSMASWTMQLNLKECVEVYSVALSALADLVWIGGTLHQRHNTIRKHKISQNASSAVFAAIHFGELEKAVEFFDQGLSLTHRQNFQLKSQDDLLWKEYPSEASSLAQLSAQLARPSNNPYYDNGIDPSASNSNMIAIQRQKLVKSIRELPGFEEFLLPESYALLAKASINGPVIMINSTSTHTDALIILSPTKHPLHVPLPGALLKDIEQQRKYLRIALLGCLIPTRDPEVDRAGRPRDYTSPQQMFQNVISWLWNKVVKPIFDALEQNNINEGRIWWCPSGNFTYLPLHAAAPIDSLYIQSYTTTLGALLHAQSKQKLDAGLQSTGETMTIVGISNIFGKNNMELPNVQAEVDIISDICYNSGTNHWVLLNEEATIANVLTHMQNSSWLHLSCHGQQLQVIPLDSHLVLYDGNLELKRILDIAFNSSTKFVFLSACQTATGDETISNESMHLAGGFIAAGFQGAIGTLWNMADSDGPKVAKSVYEQIFGKGNNNDTNSMHFPDATKAAKGLHLAIQQLRKEGAPFQQWMPFIHFGV